jgi:TrmH family RNA methyltransferase
VPNPLDRLIVVLWQPQNLINVAATIRAMKNFGLLRLRVVSPAEWDPWRIEGIAHDTGDVVAATEHFDDLAPAIADCTFTVGTTARGRRAKRSVSRPRPLAAELIDRASSASPDEGPIAILFGREDTGLPNSILDHCHRLVTIPTNPQHSSLNLAQAVLLLGYELWMEAAGRDQPFKAPRRDAPPASVELLERMFADVERALWTIDFFKSRQTESVMRTLRELGHRADLDEREAGFLRAISMEVVKYIGRLERERGST